MKKLISVFMLVSLLAILVGCDAINQNAASDVDGLLADVDTEDSIMDEIQEGVTDLLEDNQPEVEASPATDEVTDTVVTYTEEEQTFLAFYEAIGPVDYNYTDGQVVEVSNPDSQYALANKKNQLPADYRPDDLVVADIKFSFAEDTDKRYLRQVAADHIEMLFKAAIEEEGLYLFGVSGFRSYDTQDRIFNYNVSQRGEEEANKVSARPGQSEHQTGLTMDVSSADAGYDLVTAFGDTAEGIWLADHAHLYGFHLHYLEDKVAETGYSFEPWHIRYVGVELATYLYDNHLTIDEFYEWYDQMQRSGVLEKQVTNEG